jgi:lipoate-protein ligase A
VIDALQGLGINAWYQPLNDIASPAGKIAGAAQTRRGGAVLHHVTMAYDIDTTKMLDVLRIGREKLSDKATQSAAKRVDPLRSQTGLPRSDIIKKMIATFRRRHGLAPGKLEPAELERAVTLAESKFSSTAWTGIVP